MEKYNDLTLNEKLKQMKEDYNNEWWRPSKIDNFDLKNKVSSIIILFKIQLFRVGCRPLRRKIFKCNQSDQDNDISHHKKCVNLETELKKCNELLHLVHYSSKKEELEKGI